MKGASFIAGDWGTTNLRLFLCDAQGVALDRRCGPGAAESRGRFAEVFGSLIGAWQTPRTALPAILCGMVGSNIGWSAAPYVACPARPDRIADACVALCGGGVHIVPGLSCRNRFDAPDLLRGEETQILGALNLVGSLRHGRRLLCLPGTHTKWAVVDDGTVREFLTAPTGELFALLCEHSVLLRTQDGTVAAGGTAADETAAPDADADAAGADAADADAFNEGLARFIEFPPSQLLHRIFECRSRQLTGEFSPTAAAAYLSGLMIASDVHGALAVLTDGLADRSVCVIGSPDLTRRYLAALACHGCDVCAVDGAAAALAGLTQVYRRLSSAVVP